jgi:serine/threonine-protein kinase
VSRDLAGAMIAGKYLVKRRIGEGGMGAVYEAEHVEIGKRVAVKVIEHEHARSAELAARFRREARAASAVESEHIVQVFDVGQDPEVGLYMVMELLAGEDLSSRLEAHGGKLPVEDAASIVVQTARALAKAHGAGVVHRDLKPANLFLTTREDGTTCVKVLDFGVSKLLREEEGTGPSPLVTREGAVMGTPMYMSPEQAQGMKVDARTDVWSLGAVLYEALAGRTAFSHRDTYEQMIVQIVTGRPPPLAEVAPWVPAEIARVVERALTHDLDARLADAATFARELAQAAKLPSPSRASSPSLPAPVAPARAGIAHPATSAGVVRAVSSAGSEKRSRRAAPLLLGALVVAALAVVAFVASRGPGSVPTPAGLVASAAPLPASAIASAPASASTLASAIATASAVAAASGSALAPMAPLASASPLAAASSPAIPGASASASPPALASAQARPASRVGPAAPAPSTRPSTQYGAAGVATSY